MSRMTWPCVAVLSLVLAMGCEGKGDKAGAPASASEAGKVVDKAAAEAKPAVKPADAKPKEEPVTKGEQSQVFAKEKLLPLAELKARNEQYVDVQVFVKPGTLTDADKVFLRHLLDAADVMDALFWGQSSWRGPEVRDELAKARRPLNAYDELLDRYVSINYGPFDRLDHASPFIGEAGKPDGGSYYSKGITKADLEAFLAQHPEQRDVFQSPYTTIRRTKAGLEAVPYSKEYGPELAKAAKALRAAAAMADNESLARFLKARADAFESNEYRASDGDWVDVKGSRFEVTIGPYEVYEDVLMGYKAAFEAFITKTDPVLSAELGKVKSFLGEMEAALPLDKAYRNYKRASGSPIFAVDLIYSAGDTRAGVQTLAFNLPNDEEVRERKGSKKVLLRNVSDAKFEKILQPIATKVLTKAQLPYVERDAYFWHTLLHEISHGMGPGKLTLPDGRTTTVGLELKETYSHLEEAKADTLGLWNALYLIKKGYFKHPDRKKQALITMLAGFFRSVRFGVHEAHGKANMVIYNFLKGRGVYVPTPDGRFRVDLDKAEAGIKALAAELLLIQAKGDYDGAKAFLKKYEAMPPEVAAALERLKDIPVDIRPIFSTVPAIRGGGS